MSAPGPPDGGRALCPIRPNVPGEEVEEEGVAAEEGEEDDDGEGEHPAEEARRAKKARDPGAPTRAEVEAHAATHLPFRIWCEECVAGRRDNPPHLRVPREPGGVPEVGFDYAFVRRESEEDTVTLLVMKEPGFKGDPRMGRPRQGRRHGTRRVASSGGSP